MKASGQVDTFNRYIEEICSRERLQWSRFLGVFTITVRAPKEDVSGFPESICSTPL